MTMQCKTMSSWCMGYSREWARRNVKVPAVPGAVRVVTYTIPVNDLDLLRLNMYSENMYNNFSFDSFQKATFHLSPFKCILGIKVDIDVK